MVFAVKTFDKPCDQASSSAIAQRPKQPTAGVPFQLPTAYKTLREQHIYVRYNYAETTDKMCILTKHQTQYA